MQKYDEIHVSQNVVSKFRMHALIVAKFINMKMLNKQTFHVNISCLINSIIQESILTVPDEIMKGGNFTITCKVPGVKTETKM